MYEKIRKEQRKPWGTLMGKTSEMNQIRPLNSRMDGNVTFWMSEKGFRWNLGLLVEIGESSAGPQGFPWEPRLSRYPSFSVLAPLSRKQRVAGGWDVVVLKPLGSTGAACRWASGDATAPLTRAILPFTPGRMTRRIRGCRHRRPLEIARDRGLRNPGSTLVWKIQSRLPAWVHSPAGVTTPSWRLDKFPVVFYLFLDSPARAATSSCSLMINSSPLSPLTLTHAPVGRRQPYDSVQRLIEHAADREPVIYCMNGVTTTCV